MNTGSDRSASLVEALQALAGEMAKISSEAEANSGLQKLRQIRADYLGKEDDPGAIKAARKDAEALIAWLETRLEQLRVQLARKRRSQEGTVMEQIAKQREAMGPSLLPTELVDAVVRFTEEKDPEEVGSPVSEKEPVKPETAPTGKKPRAKAKTVTEKEKEKKTREKKEKTPGKEETPADEARQPAAANQPAAPEKIDFSKYERLAAHMAASVGEDPRFFELLRKNAKFEGPIRQPLRDEQAEVHYRTIHDLEKRLVNLELHTKAIARARERKEPVSNLVKNVARELKAFLREFRAVKAENPELAGDYELRFGGWADQFSAMKPEKGGAILDQCRAERQAQKTPGKAPEKAPEREADAPQLVLKRDDNWQQ